MIRDRSCRRQGDAYEVRSPPRCCTRFPAARSSTGWWQRCRRQGSPRSRSWSDMVRMRSPQCFPLVSTRSSRNGREGTGHATRTALEGIGDVTGDTVLVIAGDTPLFRGATLRRMLDTHSGSCTVLTTRVPDPTGYGRVVRNGGAVSAIVEERDTDEITRPIDEVAMSTYVFDGSSLVAALDKVGTHNDQKEEYLTDVVGILAGLGPVGGFAVADHRETVGVNSHDQLWDAEALMRDRINRQWMEAGVWMQDPATTYLDATVTLSPGVRLYAGVHLEGNTTVAPGAVVGPQVFVVDSLDRERCPGLVLGCARRRGGGAGRRRTVRHTSSWHGAAAGLQGRQFRRDQGVNGRGRLQGAAPRLHRRYDDWREFQHRGRDDHLQFRRVPQAPDGDRGSGLHRLGHDAGCAGHDRRRRIHRRWLGDHPRRLAGCARRRAFAAEGASWLR